MYPDKIDHKTAHKILENDSLRKTFLNEYLFFGQDENKNLYAKFIRKELFSSNTNKVEDSIELALILSYREENYIEALFNEFFKRRSFFVKLEILDYYLENISFIDNDLFVNLNKSASRSKNVILKFQGLLGIVIEDKTAISEIFRILQEQKYPTLFYRLLNNMKVNETLKKIFQDEEHKIRSIIKKQSFSEKVKQDLLKSLRMKNH